MLVKCLIDGNLSENHFFSLENLQFSFIKAKLIRQFISLFWNPYQILRKFSVKKRLAEEAQRAYFLCF